MLYSLLAISSQLFIIKLGYSNPRLTADEPKAVAAASLEAENIRLQQLCWERSD